METNDKEVFMYNWFTDIFLSYYVPFFVLMFLWGVVSTLVSKMWARRKN